MATTVNSRQLGRETAAILAEVERTHRPALVVRNGRPVAALVPVDADDLEDYILANAPEFVDSMREAESDLAGGHTRPASEAIAELLGEKPAATSLDADSAVAQIVDLILTQGRRDRASHIHVEPQSDQLRVRYRIDRALRDVQALPIQLSKPIATRLKIMAGLNITESHNPQEGRAIMTVDDDTVDIRITTMETTLGEKIVIQLRDTRTAPGPTAEPQATRASKSKSHMPSQMKAKPPVELGAQERQPERSLSRR